MKWYLLAFKKYGVFSGRSTRQEYWMFFLFNIIIGVALYFVEKYYFCFPLIRGLGPCQRFYYLFALLPSISLSVRRLHDTNRRGWWLLINCIPLVGGFWYLWLMILDSDHYRNRFGDDPTAFPEVEIVS